MSQTEVSKMRKTQMIENTKKYFAEYNNYVVLNINKVKSTQFRDFKYNLPSGVKLPFIKNKILKKILKEVDEKKYEDLINFVKGNVIVAFFNEVDPKEIFKSLQVSLRKAFAIPGDFAKDDIVLMAGPTGLAPEKINLFQSAQINTKIVKGKIDIASNHTLVKGGFTVGISDANLLNLLGIMPFEFGVDILRVYEGQDVYGKDILTIQESDIEKDIIDTVSAMAALSLGFGVLTEASVPYAIYDAYSDIQKIAYGLGISLTE